MDIDLVIQDAFQQVRNSKERVDRIEQATHQNITDLEQGAKTILKALYEMNIIKLDIKALGKELHQNVDDLSLASTLVLDSSTNKAVRLAMLIDEASEGELIEALDYLKPEKREMIKSLL